jgi:hypothetical protein
MGRKIVESPKKAVNLSQFGSYGTKLQDFNPFKDE